MKKINTKIIATLALTASLSTGVVTVHAASISNNKVGLTNPNQTLASSSNKKLEVPNVKNVFLPKDKESAVKLWAEALKERNGAFRYAILSNDLKNQEYNKYSKMYWTIGGSSPQVKSYKISEINKIDNKTSEYKIVYTLTDSTKNLYYASENLTVKNFSNHYVVIKHDNYGYMPD